MHVLCDAQCFNTFLSPGMPLPSLGNFDRADTNPIHDQYIMTSKSYDVAAFRFNVNAVVSGEQPNFFPPMGNVPLTLDSNPRDRPPHRPAQPARPST